MCAVRRDDGAACDGPGRRSGGALRRSGRSFAFFVVICAVTLVTAAGGSTPLIDAVKAGDRDAIRALLKNSANVNVPEADGTTALHWAVRADDVETVRALLRTGAKANVANRNGITPLSLAALNGTRSVVEALIEAGADVNARLPQGQTALMMAARAGHVDARQRAAVTGRGCARARTGSWRDRAHLGRRRRTIPT